MTKVLYVIAHSFFTLLLCNLLEAQFSYRVSSGNKECKYDKLDVLQPSNYVQYESGKTEYYGENNRAFKCAGISVLRHTINPKGLMRPTSFDQPSLIYIEQGKGCAGLAVPGCSIKGNGGKELSKSQQNVKHSQQQGGEDIMNAFGFSTENIIAVPAAVSFWMFNDGDNDVVAIQTFSGSNRINELKPTLTESLLSGRTGQPGLNIMSRFETDMLAKSLGVGIDLARVLQNEDGSRGQIINAQYGIEGFVSFKSQNQYPQKEEEYMHNHHLDEAFCTENYIANVSEIFPRYSRGAIIDINIQNFPILKSLHLSAEIGVLQQNAVLSPFWNVNAHSMMYVTGGEGHVQVVDNRGSLVFDGHLSRGQILLLPHYFVVLQSAGQQGIQWVSVKTSDNAIVNKLAGKSSTFESLPVGVIANTYHITEEQARMLKYGRIDDVSLFMDPSHVKKEP